MCLIDETIVQNYHLNSLNEPIIEVVCGDSWNWYYFIMVQNIVVK